VIIFIYIQSNFFKTVFKHYLFFFLSDNEFRIRESNEEIMCAKELLTLGQNFYSKVNSLSCSLFVEEDVNKEFGQVVVHVSSPVNSKNQFETNPKSPLRTFLNVDGTFSDSSDSAGESDCENVSLSFDRPARERVSLKKHSGSKSTVEGSCPSALAKNPFDSVKKCKKKKRTKIISSLVRVIKNSEVKNNFENGELMVGDCPPSSFKLQVASGCFPIPGKSPEVKNSAVESGNCVNIRRQQQSQDQTDASGVNLGSFDSESSGNMNTTIVSTAEGTIVTMANAVTTFSFQQGGRATTLTSVPASVCMPSINGATGHIVAVAGMNLGHSPPVLVFSANSGFASAGSPAGNLILGNFSGTAVPMALFPGSASTKMVSATQVSLQGGDILKLTSGGGGLNTVQSLPGGLLALPPGAFQLGTAAATAGPVLTINNSGGGGPIATMVSTPPHVISDSSGGGGSGGTSLVPPEPPAAAATASSSSSDAPVETAAYDSGLKEMRMEPTYKEDGTVEWNCNVCFKVRIFYILRLHACEFRRFIFLP
jgi:hypothetical protein